jgi:phosphate-selective porin OprO/OprP
MKRPAWGLWPRCASTLLLLALQANGAAQTMEQSLTALPPIGGESELTFVETTPLTSIVGAEGQKEIQEPETNDLPPAGLKLDGGVIPIANYIQFGECQTCPPGMVAAEAKPKYPLIIVSGAAQIDGIWFDQDAANAAVVGDARDVAGFRRARLGANGFLAENVRYRMEYDFAFPGRPNFTDVWVDVFDLPTVGHFKVGQWKQPFSMEPATSFRELMFMERSLAFALVPFRQVGAGFFNTAFDEQATWAWSGYRFPTDQFGNVASDNGYGMSTRETMLLYDDGCENIVHLGGGYTYNEPAGNTLRIRSTPEVGFTQLDSNNTTDFPIPFFVNTGFLPTDSYQVVGGEFAAGFGSMVFQSEYMYAMLDRPAGTQLNFPAGYAQLGYVLTGERRKYDKKTAAFTRVVPDVPFGKGSWGAWEVAGRYSALDCNDQDVQGGRLQDLTFGLNWYLNRFTRFEFNYIHPMLDRPVGNDTDADVFGTRAQFDF